MNLSAKTQKHLSNYGIEKPNLLQQTVLDTPDKNLVILSPTGSGKTLGFLLPLFENMEFIAGKTQALIQKIGNRTQSNMLLRWSFHQN
jgi:ATP-dependent RNA helicase DeaD